MLAVYLLASSSVCLLAAEEQAAKPIPGNPGVVLSRSVVNFSELARREASLPARPPVPKVQPPAHERPSRKALPPGAIIKLTPRAAATVPAAVGPPNPRTLVLANSFPAEADNNTVIPPDTQGTVGPNHLMVTLNSNVVVEDRSGNRLETVSLDAFWAPTGNSVTTDPRIVYDPSNDRWIMATSGDFQRPTSGVLVGVTQTGDPTGNWNLYKVAVDNTSHHFCDFPVLGFNKRWVVVMCNVFDNNPNIHTFSGNIYVFDKFDLYNHGAGIPVVLDDNIDNNPNGGDSNVTPAITYDNNLDTEYLVEEYNGNQAGMGTMRLWAITGAVGSPVLSSIAFPATSVPWDEHGANNFAPQSGIAFGIDVGDARIGNVIYRNGTLWTTHPVFYPCCAPSNPPNRSAIQWWQIGTDGSVLQRGVIDNPDLNYFRSYPSIAVNRYNDALIGYARFSVGLFAGAAYSFRASSDPPGALQTEATLKAGEATYVKTGSGGNTSNRWGDYSNTSVDPTDDISFWTIQEYAAAPSSHWATWWGQVVLPPVAFQVTPSPGTTVIAGVPLSDLAVTIVDSQGHAVPAYTGTVHFTSTDPRFALPDYTFVPADQGTHHFSGVTLFKAGAQSITLTDAANSLQATVNFTVLPGPLAAFVMNGPATATAGAGFNFSVTAQDAFQNTIQSYNGTVQFSSSDPIAILPGNYTFNPGVDNGSHTFPAILKRAGTQSIIVFAGSIFASISVSVAPAAADHLMVSAPANVTSTKAFTLGVTAQDPFNNVATGYLGTVQFSTSDAAHTLPANYTFTAGDKGIHYFVNGATLNTIGTQTVTATDTVTGSITGSASVNVAHLSGVARSLYVRLGQPFNNLTLAFFTDDKDPSPASLSANIDWGDGASGPGTITSGGGGYFVSGSHAYVLPPKHPITISISDTLNGYGPVLLTGKVRMWPKTESH